MVNFDWALAGIEERLDIRKSWPTYENLGATNKTSHLPDMLNGGRIMKTETPQAPMFAPSIPRSDNVEASENLQMQVMEQMVEVLSKIRTQKNNDDEFWRNRSLQQRSRRASRRMAPHPGAHSQSNTTVRSRATLCISGLNTPGPESAVESSGSSVSEVKRPVPELIQGLPHPVSFNPGLDLEFKLLKLNDKFSFADRLFDPALSLSYMGLGTCKPDGFQDAPKFSRFDFSGFQLVFDEISQQMESESTPSECTESQETGESGGQCDNGDIDE